MNYKGSLSLTALCVPLFVLFGSVLFELMIQLTALITLSLSLGVSLTLPTIAVAIGIVAVLVAQFQIALGLSLPSFNVNFAVSIDFELAIVVGLLLELEALLGLDATLCAYGWLGSAAELGAAATSQLATWPDGTSGEQPITAYLFVATTTGAYTPDQIDSLGLVAAPTTPPTPQHPPPPAGSYPPPQAYERGLASVSITAPSGTGIQATGTLTVDDSVATGIGAVTGVSIVEHGSGYTSPPTITISDTATLVSIASGSPVILTLPSALAIPVGQGFGCSIAAVVGAPTINGPANAKVLSPTTIALYADAGFTQPIAGFGSYTGGTITGGGSGAAATATMGGGAQNAIKTLLDGLLWPNVPGTLIGRRLDFWAMMPTIEALLGALRTELKARESLLAGVKIGVDVLPPSIDASIDLLLKISANLKANLNVKLPDLTASAAAALDGQISAIANLTAQIGFFVGLGAAGITLEIYEYQGPGSQLGAAIANGPGSLGWHDGTGPSTPVVAALFGLTNPSAVTAFDVFFAGAA